jgi:hypothetical protein
MRKWIRNWLFKEGGQSEIPHYAAENVLRHSPAIQAYKITNGFIICSEGTRSVTFCKDHQEIADHIVKQSAVDKLVGQQLELPLSGMIGAAKVFR